MTSKRTGKLVVAFLMFAASEADAGAKKPSAVQIQASIFGLVMEQATFADAQGRPVPLIETGEPIRELLRS